MSYSIKIDHDNKIIRYNHFGEISAEAIGEVWGELLKIQEFTHNKYNLLSNYGDGKMEVGIDQIPDIVAFMKNIEPIVRGKKQAIIAKNSYSAAASLIFEESVYAEVGFDVRVFYTLDTALEWVTSTK